MKYTVRSLVLVSSLCTLAINVTACSHTPSSIVTPAGKTAYTADQIVKRVGEFQDAVIQANKSGALKDADATALVAFCVDAATVLKTTPAGWQATVGAAWGRVKARVPAVNDPRYATYVLTFDALLASVGA